MTLYEQRKQHGELYKFHCDPVTASLIIGGLASSVGGTVLQENAASNEQSQMNQAEQSELNAQKGYQKQGQQDVESNILSSSPTAAKTDIATGTAQAQDQYSKLNAIPLTASSGNSAIASATSGNNIVGQDAAARTNMSNAASAPLQGYNDWQVGQWIKNLQTNSSLSQIQANSQNRENILPIEMQAAQNSSSGEQGIGSLLKTLGSVLGTFGSTGVGSSLLGGLFSGGGGASAGAAGIAPALDGTVGDISNPFLNFLPKTGGFSLPPLT